MPDIVKEVSLSGALRAGDTLRGNITAEVSLSGMVNAAAVADIPAYDGEYTVEPKLREEIIMQTKGRRMTADVTVSKVPSYEVTNEAGGITFILGGT